MGQDLMEWLLENADFDHRNGYQFKKVISMITRYRAVMEQAVEALYDCEATLEVMRTMGKAIDHTQCIYMMNEAGDTIDHFVDPAITTLRKVLKEK